MLRTYGYRAHHRVFRLVDERTLAVKMYTENLAMSRKLMANLIAEKMRDVNALLQARRSSDKRTFVADEFFQSVNELCVKQDFESVEEVRVAMRTKALDVHLLLTGMLKKNLETGTHAQRREQLESVVHNREECGIFLNDERYVIGRLMSEMENSLRKFSGSVPPAAILCLVDEMYREIRERYEFQELPRDVVEMWIFQRLLYMYVEF